MKQWKDKQLELQRIYQDLLLIKKINIITFINIVICINIMVEIKIEDVTVEQVVALYDNNVFDIDKTKKILEQFTKKDLIENVMSESSNLDFEDNTENDLTDLEEENTEDIEEKTNEDETEEIPKELLQKTKDTNISKEKIISESEKDKDEELDLSEEDDEFMDL